MSFLSQTKLKADRIRQRGMNETYLETPSFSETMSLSYQRSDTTDLLRSETDMRERFQGPDKDKLQTMRADGTISDEVWNSFTKYHPAFASVRDWEGLGNYANEEFDTDFDFSEEKLYEGIRTESENLDRRLGKASAWGIIPGFFGAGGSMLTDPIQAAAMVIPGSQMKFGSSTMRTLTKMAFREGLINVAVEAPVQLGIADFRERIGLKYNLSEGAVNLAAAFAFGGVMGAGRAGVRINAGDTNLLDGIEVGEAIIKEMDSRVGPMMPIDAANLDDVRFSTDVFKQMLVENPNSKNMSARDAYTEVAYRMRPISDPFVNPETNATVRADTDLEAVTHAPDELSTDFVPDDIDMDAPLPDDLVGSRQAVAVGEDGVAQPVTMRTLYDEVDAAQEGIHQRTLDYVECRNG